MPGTAATDERLEQYARLTVQIGLNLQPGQLLCVNALIEHAPFAQAIAREAYAAGGYEVETSPFAPGAAEIVVEESLRMLHELWSAA